MCDVSVDPEDACPCGRAPEGQDAAPLGRCHDCGRLVCWWCGCSWNGYGTDNGRFLCDECAQRRLGRQGARGEVSSDA